MADGKICQKCGMRNEVGAEKCSNCNAPLNDQGVDRIFGDDTNRVKVQIVDVSIPFWSMVVLMVKWAIASIPALIILIVLAVILFGGLAGYLGYSAGVPRY